MIERYEAGIRGRITSIKLYTGCIRRFHEALESQISGTKLLLVLGIFMIFDKQENSVISVICLFKWRSGYRGVKIASGTDYRLDSGCPVRGQADLSRFFCRFFRVPGTAVWRLGRVRFALLGFFRGLCRALGFVGIAGRVPAAAFKVKRALWDKLGEFARAVITLDQRFLGKFLQHFFNNTALGTFIFVNRHFIKDLL